MASKRVKNKIQRVHLSHINGGDVLNSIPMSLLHTQMQCGLRASGTPFYPNETYADKPDNPVTN